jgi:hypothetical protein
LNSSQVLSMGLAPLDAHRWIEPDATLPHWYAHKQDVRARLGSRVCRATPESLPAQREASTLLAAHLLRDHPAIYCRAGTTLHCGDYAIDFDEQHPEPLWAISLAVADDLLLLQPRGDEYVLTAASLCSPSHWRLEEKFEQPMSTIHGPIPGFTGALQPRVERFLQHLHSARPVERFNWGLQRGAALCARHAEADEGALHYRCERQTLSRLPGTGAILFTIRVYLCPLDSLSAVPGALQTLLQAIDACPPALAVYKGFERLADDLKALRGTYG